VEGVERGRRLEGREGERREDGMAEKGRRGEYWGLISQG